MTNYTLEQYADKQGPEYVAFGLTGFGSRFVETGILRGYGYVYRGTTGYTTPAVKLSPKWEAFRAALASQDSAAILQAAKPLPSVSTGLRWSYGGGEKVLSVSYKGALLFTARRIENHNCYSLYCSTCEAA